MSLVTYLIAATYYFYDFLCTLSQKLKGFDEDKKIQNYTKYGRFEDQKNDPPGDKKEDPEKFKNQVADGVGNII